MISITIFQLRRSISCTHRFILINKSGSTVSFRCTTSSPFVILHYGEEENNKYVSLKPQRNAEVKRHHCVKNVQILSFFWRLFFRIRTLHAVAVIFRSSQESCFMKKGGLKNFAVLQENTLVGVYFSIKLQVNIVNIFCEYCEIRNIYFEKHLRTAASRYCHVLWKRWILLKIITVPQYQSTLWSLIDEGVGVGERRLENFPNINSQGGGDFPKL